MNFGAAIEALKAGHRVARAGTPYGECLFLVPGALSTEAPDGSACAALPSIDAIMIDSNGGRFLYRGWTASAVEMLAEDWVIVSE